MDLYGQTAGILGATLWVICPTVLANAQMITPDTAAAAFGVAAGYLFWQWLRDPSWCRVLTLGFVLGLTELCKTTWLVLIPLWPALWVLDRFGRPDGCLIRRKEGAQLMVAGMLATLVLNAGYGFEGTCQRVADFEFISNSLSTETVTGIRTNRFTGTVVGDLPVPLPRNYVQGIDVQKRDFELGMWSYLRGEWRTEGWWYYYLYGLLVKTPIGTLLLAALSALTGPFLRHPGAGWREEMVLLIPGLTVLGFVSSQTGFNHHLRYVLPALPFLFIWVGRVSTYRGQFRRIWTSALLIAAAAAAVSSLRIYPHAMSYFNEAAGGPLGGSAHLVDSNIDWGQDLLYLKAWYDTHPEARPFHLAYFGGVDPRAAGIEFSLLPSGPVSSTDGTPPADSELVGPQPGWHAVSVTLLRGYRLQVPNGQGGSDFYESNLSYFLKFKPIATAGYSIWIYHISQEECNRVRPDLGLQLLPAGPGHNAGLGDAGGQR